jgi:hypothetical protein
MFDEPNEEHQEDALDPAQQAQEKSDEFRIHAELCAVFEGHRKFDAELRPGLDDQLARDIQKRIARLEKAKAPDSPILPPASAAEAAELLNLPKTQNLATNDYHVSRRPGEAIIVRWLEGDQVNSFYERIQAHFDVALNQYREEEHQAQDWKQDPHTVAYLKALDALDVRLADRYLRDLIRQHKLFVLSTLTAEEMDILHLCDYVMGIPAADVVGRVSAPPEEPTEQDRAWFFRLFSLRGLREGVEQMCFFAYLQKSEDTFDL